ncbi:hypothetical protein SMX26_001908 [Cronobacter universalis]|nr:hypothetical protein [Cronobacter universalis]
MMTIDTAKLKAAAEKAKDNFIPNVLVSTHEVLELIAALEAARADCRENAARIAELESQRALAFSACNRWADKCRDAEKRVAELEARTFKLPESVIDSICLTAAEIHNLGRGVSDERAQDIIDSIRCAAGINLETGGE